MNTALKGGNKLSLPLEAAQGRERKREEEGGEKRGKVHLAGKVSNILRSIARRPF